MKQLLLLRHAKSSHSGGQVNDHDRLLNERGEREAPMVGRYLVEQDLIPQRTISSTASRAERTAVLLLKECGLDPPQLDERLYLAAPQTITELAMECDESTDRLLLVGHNPGMESLASQLSNRYLDLKTAHLAVFQFYGIAWNDSRWLTKALLLLQWRAGGDV